MRRIFGNTNLPASSTSTSLNSDGSAPLSPTYPAASLSRSTSNLDDPPLTPTGDPGEAARKGWFGSLGTGLSRTQSTTSNGTTSQNGGAGGSGSVSGFSSGLGALLSGVGGGSVKSDPRGEEDAEEFSPERLPFGGSRATFSPTLGAPLSPGRTGSAGAHTRQSSRSSFGIAPPARPFSPEGILAVAEGSTGGHRTMKDDMLVELLSGQASMEAREYEVLDWEEMQEVKKEHAIISTRLASLSRSLALETRLRDSAAKLVRLSAPSPSSSLASPPYPNSPSTRSKGVSREQAAAQLATAQSKLDALTIEHAKLSAKEGEMRTRLLKHTAGVLALSLRRKEEEEQGLSVAVASPTSATFARHDSSSPARSADPTAVAGDTSATPRPPNSAAFDSASFFAGNREAINPLSQSRTSQPHNQQGQGSPYSSPSLGGSTSAFTSPHNHHLQQAHDLAADSESRIRELEAELASAVATSSAATAEIGQLKTALGAAETTTKEGARKLRDLGMDLAESEHKLGEASARAEEAEEQSRAWEQERSALEERLAAAEREVKEAKEEAGRAREEAAAAASTPATREVQPQVDDHSAAHLARIHELEAERTSLAVSIGDVLRRHRTRPVLGPVLRALPTLDDSPSSPLLRTSSSSSHGPSSPNPSSSSSSLDTIAKTLDAHFSAASSHVESLSTQLAEHERTIAQAEESSSATASRETSNSTDSQLLLERAEQAEERVADLETEVAEVKTDREGLEVELRVLREQAAEIEDRLRAREAEHEQAGGAREEEVERLGREREELVGRVKQLEAALEEREQERTRLEELHASLPPPTGAAPTRSVSPLLPSRKKVGNFLADVASKAKDAAATLSSTSNSSSSAISNGSSSPSTSPNLSLATLPSAATGAVGGFSVEVLVERVKGLVEERRDLVRQLEEAEAARGREREELTRTGGEERGGLERKIKDLEERIEISANQEVSMLERLNDLTESLESTRSSKRQLELRIQTLESEAASAASAAAAAPATAGAGGSGDELELQELRDQIADLEDELEDARKREQKTRSSLLEELSTAQNDVSSLKTQLRQAQRKAGGAARA